MPKIFTTLLSFLSIIIMIMSQVESVRMCLHFDINKSIIMTDVGSGRSMGQTLNSLLSECTWGLSDEKPLNERTENDWKCCYSEPSTDPPVPGAITLGTYLEDFTLVPKKTQTKIKRSFTEIGELGQAFKLYHSKLDDALKIPPGCGSTAELPVLASGYYHLIPSFFRVIEYLAEQNIEFDLLFRTFGYDIDNVCEEFNMFCTGQHPLFVPSRRLDGTDHRYPHDLRIRLPYFHGKISHTNDGPNGIHMVYETPDNVEQRITGAEAMYQTIMQDWFNIPTSHSTSSSESSSSSSSSSGAEHAPTNKHTNRHTRCAAIQDDFLWWHGVNDESETSGKLMLVDCAADLASGLTDGATKTKNRVIQVFFDDNIERDRAHIVDVRDCHSFAPVPFAMANRRYLRRVEPYHAILDREYYVKEVQEVLRLHAEDNDQQQQQS